MATRIARMLPGKTLLYGDTAIEAPIEFASVPTARFASCAGASRSKSTRATWRILGDEFCRDWKKTKPSPMCLAVVGDGAKIQLFDRMGLMIVDARIVDD